VYDVNESPETDIHHKKDTGPVESGGGVMTETIGLNHVQVSSCSSRSRAAQASNIGFHKICFRPVCSTPPDLAENHAFSWVSPEVSLHGPFQPAKPSMSFVKYPDSNLPSLRLLSTVSACYVLNVTSEPQKLCKHKIHTYLPHAELT